MLDNPMYLGILCDNGKIDIWIMEVLKWKSINRL